MGISPSTDRGKEEAGDAQERLQAAVDREQQESEKEDEDEEENFLQAPPLSKASPVTASRLRDGDRRRVWEPQVGTLVPVSDAGTQKSGRSAVSSGRGMQEEDEEEEEEVCTYVHVIRCGESTIAEDVVRGRCPAAVLTGNGHRQARALGVSFLARGLRFDALLSSPIERCKQTALSVCQEINFNQGRLEFGEALMEMSNGVWEGLRKLDVYTGNIVDAMVNLNQDFHAPEGESQRQVEFRAIEYLNRVVLNRLLHQSLRHDQRRIYADHEMVSPSSEIYRPTISYSTSHALVKGKSKSRMQVSHTSTQRIGSLEGAAQHSPSMQRRRLPSSTYRIAIFSHEMTIKCILRGILGLPPLMVEQLCIDPTSVTLLRHSTIFGWKIIQVNDISHLHSI